MSPEWDQAPDERWLARARAAAIRAEPEEFISVGNKVVAPMRMLARGSGSENELTTSVTWVSTFDDRGFCTKVEAYENRDDALRAAELAE